MKTGKSLNECIDLYCAQHAVENRPEIKAIFDARELALETEDPLKFNLNDKILTELMRNYTDVMLHLAQQERDKLGDAYETSI
jgi:hypothetical protein